MNIPDTEKISAYTHGGTVPVMIIGTIILLILSAGNTAAQISFFNLRIIRNFSFQREFSISLKKSYRE